MIEKVNLHDDGKDYLDCRSIVLDQKVNKIALCLDASIGYTKDRREPFVRFTLKDCNGSTIVARVFSVEKASAGYAVSSYRNVPVRVKGIVGSFNGVFTLQLDSVDDVQKLPVTAIDYAPFLGELVTNNQEFLNNLYSSYNMTFPAEYKTESLLSVFGGRVGGFAKMMELALFELYQMRNLPGFDQHRIIPAFLHASKYLFQKLKKEQEIEILSNYFTVELVARANTEFSEYKDRTLVLDMIMALCDVSKPEQLGSILAKHLVTNILQSFRLLDVSCVTLPGTRTAVGSDVLLNG